MPYKDASDPGLPAAVKRLPKALRELWVKIFNEHYDPAHEDEAFRYAWGVVKKVKSAKKARLLSPFDLDGTRRWLSGEQDDGDDEETPPSAEEDPSTMQPRAFQTLSLAFKSLDPNRWLLLTSGAFQDRQGQIMSQAYLEDALTFAKKANYRGTVNLWHIPHSDVGTCDFQALIGEPGLLLESGLFDDTFAGRKAAAYYGEHAPEMGASLEFLWMNRTPEGVHMPPGVIVRRSLLPYARASFPWSSLAMKENNMSNQRPEVVAEFARVLGITDDQAEQMLLHLESGAKELKDYGIAWKETDVVATPAAAEAVVETPSKDAPTSEVVESVSKSEDAAPEVAVTTATASEAVQALAAAEPLEVVLTPDALQMIVKQTIDAVQPLINAIDAKLAELAQNMLGVAQEQVAYGTAMKEVRGTVDKLSTADEAKITEAVRNLPRATVKSLTAPAQRPTQRQVEAETADTNGETMLDKAHKTLYG